MKWRQFDGEPHNASQHQGSPYKQDRAPEDGKYHSADYERKYESGDVILSAPPQKVILWRGMHINKKRRANHSEDGAEKDIICLEYVITIVFIDVGYFP